MPEPRNLKHGLLRLLPTLAMVWVAWGVYGNLQERYLPIIRKGTLLPRSLLVALVICVGFITLVLLQVWKPGVFTMFNRLRRASGWLSWIFALAAAAFTSWFFLYTKWSEVFSGFYLRLVFYLLTLWVIAWLITRSQNHVISWHPFLVALLLFGSVFILASALTGVNDYPFGLYWSEGNRLWDYSVLYGARLYDYPPAQRILAYIDAGRQSLWGLPHLFNGVTITTARLWNAFLFTIPYFLFGLFAFYNVKRQHVGVWVLAGLWTMVFLNQGPIYTPLVLASIIVAATRKMPLWLGMLAVLLASFYVVSTRSTWMFAPGIWGAVLAFVESDNKYAKKSLHRWLRAVSFGLAGLAGSQGLNSFIGFFSNLDKGSAAPSADSTALGAVIGAAGRQPLLWDRLWPNPTYPMGIVFSLLIAVGPLLILLAASSIRNKWQLDLWQKLVLWVSSLAFLVVGLIVSMKIGGGSNLHNLDMFLISLVLTAGLAFDAGLFKWIFQPFSKTGFLHAVLFLLFAIGVTQNILAAAPRVLPSQEKADEALTAIRSAISARSPQEDILFIDQRQLLTFGLVPRIPLIPEYEKKYMMDEAMADNAAYFVPFIRDLYEHRFSVIISEPLWIRFQGGNYHFGNENDVWVKWVSIPVLCYYQPVETFLDVGIQILEPRTEPLQEPGVVCPTP